MSMGILPPSDLIKQAPYIGNAMELILLSMGLADRFNYQQEQALIKEKELTENLESSHQKLNIMYTKIERANEELEEKVVERTKEILESEKNVSNLLNNMRQSVFSIDEKGLIIPPVSDYSYELFGENIERKSIFETLLKNIDKKSEIYCQLTFVIDVALEADLFQYQIIQDSLPRELPFIDKDEKEKSLKINYAPIVNKDDIVQKIMLVVEDITELKKLEKDAIVSEAASAIKIKRLQEIVSQDKKSFRTFSRDVSLNFNLARKSIEKRDINGFFRAIHTVKGNARIYNLTGLSGEIHIIESQVIELRDNLIQKELSKNQLEEIFNGFEEAIEVYLGLAREVFGDDIDETFSFLDTDSLEISKSLFLNSLEQLKQMAHENNSSGILDVVKKLSFEKFNNSLLGIQKIVLKISTSLNKNIQLDILGDDIYLDVKKTSMLKDSIMHIIQNSCDHGIENKGVIKIKILEEEKDISIIISDNGKGIDPLVIKKMALEKGVVGVEEVKNFGLEENLSLIMRPGFSTKKVATEYSGRGVGLDVVQTNIRDLGGSIKLSSILGEGTTFQIIIPKS
jgi:two-component system chemotaxis sensor kinase CheA